MSVLTEHREPGRKSGGRYWTPVQPLIQADERWPVAPYGEREGVENTRAAGDATADAPLGALAAEASRHPVFQWAAAAS